MIAAMIDSQSSSSSEEPTPKFRRPWANKVNSDEVSVSDLSESSRSSFSNPLEDQWIGDPEGKGSFKIIPLDEVLQIY